MKFKSLILLILLSLPVLSNAQTLSKYGVKGGLVFCGITTVHDLDVFIDESAVFNFLSYDFGIFGEFFNSRRFCLSAELHFTRKGERNPNFIKVPMPGYTNQGEFYEIRYISDRFNNLSFQVLPRYRFIMTPAGENMYLLGGLRLDMMVSYSNSDNPSKEVGMNISKPEIGFSAGLGIELMDLLTFEFRYEHNFTGPYALSYGDKSASRVYNSLVFLTGFALNRLRL